MPLAVLIDPEQKVASIIHDQQDLQSEVDVCLGSDEVMR